jgi:SAM-dependent methyltransferase
MRKILWKFMRRISIEAQGSLLDFGCGNKPYEGLFHKVSNYVGLDLEPMEKRVRTNKADYYFDGKVIPFPDSTFDAILCSEVLEHVFDVRLTLNEFSRVMKQDGRLFLTVPFMFGEHESPFDFGRYTSFGITHLLSEHGFRIEELTKSPGGMLTTIQIAIASAFEFTHNRQKWIGAIMRVLFMLPVALLNVLSIPLSHFNKSKNSIYLSLNIVAIKL